MIPVITEKPSVIKPFALSQVLSIPMTPEGAVIALKFAALACAYLKENQQKSVNHEFDAQVPSRSKGEDVYADDIQKTNKTLKDFQKLETANLRAVEKAQSAMEYHQKLTALEAKKS